jgi:hypothetical protein
MNFIVEDGSGKTDSNSYVGIDFVDSYHEDIGNSSWDNYSLPVKQQGCVKATQFIDLSFSFSGIKNTREQALEFPRAESIDRNGYEIPDDEVPVEIKKATAECALLLLDNPELNSDTFERIVKREKTGPIEKEYDVNNEISNQSFAKIKNYLRGIGYFDRYSSGGFMTMRM